MSDSQIEETLQYCKESPAAVAQLFAKFSPKLKKEEKTSTSLLNQSWEALREREAMIPVSIREQRSRLAASLRRLRKQQRVRNQRTIEHAISQEQIKNLLELQLAGTKLSKELQAAALSLSYELAQCILKQKVTKTKTLQKRIAAEVSALALPAEYQILMHAEDLAKLGRSNLSSAVSSSPEIREGDFKIVCAAGRVYDFDWEHYLENLYLELKADD